MGRVDSHVTDEVNLKDSGGTVIDPATETTLASVLSVLQAIDTNTDELEVTLGDVDLNTDQVEALLTTLNGQTDQLETLLTSLDGKDYATETTLATILTEATWTTRMGEVSLTPTANTVLGRLKDITDELQDLELDVENVNINVDEVEAKLDTLEVSLTSIEGKLDTLIATDFATETTLSSVLGQLDITLSGLRDALQGTGGKDLTTVEADLESILSKLTELDSAFDAEDFASETTLADLNTAIGDSTDAGTTAGGAGSVHAKLRKVTSQLNDITNELQGLDLNTDELETKLDTIETSLNSIDTTLGTPRQEDGHGSAESTPSHVLQTIERVAMADLTFDVTLSSGETHETDWTRVDRVTGLLIDTEVETNAAYEAKIEFTNADDPNTTPPDAGDVVREVSTTVAGTGLGGIEDPSFYIPAQMTWARITVTDATGGQRILVDTEDVSVDPGAPQVPFKATLTPDFRAPIGQSMLRVENEATGDVDRVLGNVDGHLKVNMGSVDPTLHSRLIGADAATFGAGIVGHRVNQVDVQFHEDPDPDQLVNVITKTGSASSTRTSGIGQFNTGVDTDMEYLVESQGAIIYYSAHEVFAYQTLAWPTPPTNAGDLALAGLINQDSGTVNEAYKVGYKGTDFGIRYTRGGTEVDFITQANFNGDPLDGSSMSLFTRDGVPEALDQTKVNIFRTRFGWLSAAPTIFEVLAPDGHWVEFHSILHPNTLNIGQTESPNFNLGLHLQKVASDATDIEMRTGCWAGGIVGNIRVAQQPDGDYVPEKATGEALRLTTPLSAGETGTSEWIDTDGWASAQIVIVADQPSTEEGVEVQFTEDAQAPTPENTIQRTFTLDQEVVDTGGLTLTVDTVLDGMRLVYENGPTGQNEFLAVVTLSTQSRSPQNTLVSKVSNQAPALMTRGSLIGRNSNDEWDDIRRGPEGGLETEIVNHQVETPIESLVKFDTGQVNIDSAAPTQILQNLDPDVRAVRISNLDPDLLCYFGNDNGLTQLNGDVIFPLTSLEPSIGPGDVEAPEFWLISQAPENPQSTQTHRLDATASGTSGTATNPDDAISSDDLRATLDAQGEFIDASGYDATAQQTLDEVVDVFMGIEARKVGGGNQTIGHEETTTAAQTGGTSITTDGALSAVDGDFYLAFIVMRDHQEVVQSVSGLGLSWQNLTTATNVNGVKVSVWYANDTPTSGGAVTANFQTAVTSCQIAASRWSGVHPTSPIDSSATTSGSTAGWSVSPPTSNGGDRIVGCAAITLDLSPGGGNDPGGDDTEHSDRTLGGTANERLTVATQSRQASGSGEPTDGTWESAGQWAAVALSLNQAPLEDPEVLLEYEVDAEGTGATTGTHTVALTSDADYETEITGDRAWTYANIDATTVTATLQNAGALNLEVDHVYIEFVEGSTGGTIRVSFSTWKKEAA